MSSSSSSILGCDLPRLFQELGLSLVVWESGFTKHGPFSYNRPGMDEAPGPPFIQMDRGAFSGSLRASKNQKNVLMG